MAHNARGVYEVRETKIKQEEDMEFDEWYDRMMDNGDSPLHYLVTQREKMRLAWNESRRISDTPILSAVPSEEEIEIWAKRYIIGLETKDEQYSKEDFKAGAERMRNEIISRIERGIAG